MLGIILNFYEINCNITIINFCFWLQENYNILVNFFQRIIFPLLWVDFFHLNKIDSLSKIVSSHILF